MKMLLAFPIVFILVLLQTTIGRQFTLLHGTGDLLLLWITAWGLQRKDRSIWVWAVIAISIMILVSALPWYIYFVSITAIVLITRFMANRLWQSPLMSMFVATILGSIILFATTFLSLSFSGIALDFQITLVQVIIPSMFINLFLAIPIFAIVKDTAKWMDPAEELE